MPSKAEQSKAESKPNKDSTEALRPVGAPSAFGKSVRTYDRKTYLGAKRAWDEGSFGPEWDYLRVISWDRGFPYPPIGSREDQREEDPTQRAIIWEALSSRSMGTTEIVRQSKNWGDVVARIIHAEARLNLAAAEEEAELAGQKERLPSPEEAALALANVGYWKRP